MKSRIAAIAALHFMKWDGSQIINRDSRPRLATSTAKAIEISNTIRKAFGLQLVETSETHTVSPSDAELVQIALHGCPVSKLLLGSSPSLPVACTPTCSSLAEAGDVRPNPHLV
ncbi:hypothetical protein FA15DRAFT_711306 [Coprinopsis marcescibilis]|uniref:Uncharacterized protein n=1 Tax=Coprinopsis marcescibilis TaxID=230819 RepID=A0A5C3KAL9_COPMA|nr:hypothetical protein FA15DRAFT_711306 [Coprinopsis marcescibilis]